jgi:hypothetical protein
MHTAKSLEDLAASMRSGVEDLARRGRFDELSRVLIKVAKELRLSEKALDDLLVHCKEVNATFQNQFGSELKLAAEKARCFFDYKPPIISFGCVRLRQTKPGHWIVHVIDNAELEVVRSDDAQDIAAAALRRIDEIDGALKSFDSFAAALKSAYGFFKRLHGRVEELSPNLLMLICGGGPSVVRQLAGLGETRCTSLGRHQMGYLLASLRRRHAEGDGRLPRIAFRGATQHVTTDPYRYVSIPHTDDPREPSEPCPVTGISLHYPSED